MDYLKRPFIWYFTIKSKDKFSEFIERCVKVLIPVGIISDIIIFPICDKLFSYKMDFIAMTLILLPLAIGIMLDRKFKGGQL